jgi:hypothetical protein
LENIYWFQFDSKVSTPYSLNEPENYLSIRAIERREKGGIAIDSTDLPVNPEYLDSLGALGFYVKQTSKWLNGALVVVNEGVNIDSIDLPSFVVSYELRKEEITKSTSTKFSDSDSTERDYYGSSYIQLAMLNGQSVHNESKGNGVHVAIIDAGFLNVNQIGAFDSLFARNGVLGTMDFVDPGNDVYQTHYHGTAVLSIMAAYQPGELIGAANEASYWLLRSEDASAEYPAEEDYWIAAAEFADSVGCDVINTSLGYTTFDDTIFDHSYDDFDGKTLRISQAANLAVEKGIVVVCSAGNSGADSWKYISAPAEAQNVLSVAAVDSNRIIASFSSRGFEGDAYPPKPDISAMGVSVTYASETGSITQGNGTSFSSPIIAGMAACLVACYPEKNASEIISLIKSTGDLYPSHSLEYGYGIPDFSLLFDTTSTQVTNIVSTDIPNIYPNPFNSNLTIQSSEGYKQFTLFSFTGEKIVTSTLNKDTSTEISSSLLSKLPKGVYFAVLKGEQKIESFKLIKN